MGNVREQGEKPVNLGLEKLQVYLKPGEILLTNAPDVDKMGFSLAYMSAQQIIFKLKKKGDYESVRMIPKAFSFDGVLIEGCASVIVKRKEIPSTGN